MENQNYYFDTVIWTDETTVQLENHRRFSHRKCGEKPRPKPRYMIFICVVFSLYIHMYFRPKHPVKIHVLAGISMNGRTNLVMFYG